MNRASVFRQFLLLAFVFRSAAAEFFAIEGVVEDERRPFEVARAGGISVCPAESALFAKMENDAKMVEAMPAAPEELSKASVEGWVKSAIENTTTIMIVWKDTEPYTPAVGKPSPYDTMGSIKRTIPQLVVAVLEGSLRPRSFPDDFGRSAVLALVEESLQFRETHLKAVKQGQISGVPRTAAQPVADFLVTNFPDVIKFAEVDAVVTIRDPPQPYVAGNEVASGPAAGFVAMLE